MLVCKRRARKLRPLFFYHQARTVRSAKLVGDFGVRVRAVARPLGNIEIRGFESACPASQLRPLTLGLYPRMRFLTALGSIALTTRWY